MEMKNNIVLDFDNWNDITLIFKGEKYLLNKDVLECFINNIAADLTLWSGKNTIVWNDPDKPLVKKP